VHEEEPDGEYVPIEHASQESAPAELWNWPARQLVQLEAPEVEYEATGHVKHV
jgi:hypothetical protein